MDSLFLTTKLRIPPTPQFAVTRQRVAGILENKIAHYKLVLISAAAGYGKTTLLAQWAAASRLPVAWLSVGKEDNNLADFFRYLLLGWEQTQPGVRESPLGLRLGAGSPDPDAVLAAFINVANTLSEPIAFVLDDYHLIEDPAIHIALTFLLDHLPPTIHLVLAGRAEPPLPLARYRAHQILLEFSTENLAFSLEESAEFLNGMMQLMSDDCVFENTNPVPDGAVYSGKEAVTQFWQDFFRESPQAHIEIEEIFGFGERCVMRWKYNWVDIAGAKGHVRGVDIFRVRSGAIHEKPSYVKG